MGGIFTQSIYMYSGRMVSLIGGLSMEEHTNIILRKPGTFILSRKKALDERRQSESARHPELYLLANDIIKRSSY
jgi:hypothetical protein